VPHKGKSTVFSTNGVGGTEYLCGKKKKDIGSLTNTYKNEFKMIQIFNVRAKPLQESLVGELHNMGFSVGLSDLTPKVHARKRKISWAPKRYYKHSEKGSL
jgi:hypothetical protein